MFIYKFSFNWNLLFFIYEKKIICGGKIRINLKWIWYVMLVIYIRCLNEWWKNVGYYIIWKFLDVWVGYGVLSFGKIVFVVIIRNIIII